MTDFFIPARCLSAGQTTDLGVITKIDRTTNPGVVYVWHDLGAPANVYNHGERVRVRVGE